MVHKPYLLKIETPNGSRRRAQFCIVRRARPIESCKGFLDLRPDRLEGTALQSVGMIQQDQAQDEMMLRWTNQPFR
jgi:hypothetical protein